MNLFALIVLILGLIIGSYIQYIIIKVAVKHAILESKNYEMGENK